MIPHAIKAMPPWNRACVGLRAYTYASGPRQGRAQAGPFKYPMRPWDREPNVTAEIKKTEDEWRRELTPEQYYILREKGTERPFTGEYVHSKANGTYVCAACGSELFKSDTKFESHSGWPSFTEPANREAVDLHTDTSHGMVRTEVTCKACGGHLGHVFDDGPMPTGQRYCINSISLKLQPDEA
jgi:peptide-methionine (R)-S-oxide reductase